MSADESKRKKDLIILKNVADVFFGIQDELRDAYIVHKKWRLDYSRKEVRELALCFQNDELLLSRDDDDDASKMAVCLSRIDDRISERIIRPALRSIRAVEHLEMLINTTNRHDLDTQQALDLFGAKQLSSLRLALQMVFSMIEDLIPTAVRLLNDPSLDDTECRNRIIRFIRSGFFATHQICAQRLLECTAVIELKRKELHATDQQQPDSSPKRRPPSFTRSELEKCRELFQRKPESGKKAIQAELGVGGDKAMALLRQMRREGLSTSTPRKRRRDHLS